MIVWYQIFNVCSRDHSTDVSSNATSQSIDGKYKGIQESLEIVCVKIDRHKDYTREATEGKHRSAPDLEFNHK